MNERALEERGLGTELDGLRDGHARVDTEAACAIRGALHDSPALAPPADDEQLDIAQLRVTLAADLHEEGVKIDVNDSRRHGVPWYHWADELRNLFVGRTPLNITPLANRKLSDRVAFLGLGAIGAPMAVHLARRGPLAVWNRTADRAREFAAAHGATHAATPREAAASSDVVVTCLPTSHEVEALLDGPDGLLAGLRSGALLIDCTSGDPAGSRRIAARLAEHGVAFADAPVSGGTNGAEAGTLTVMVGGDQETFQRARAILSAFGRRIDHVGPVGAGDAVKAINQVLLGLNILAVGEGLAALVKAGVNPRMALDVINASSGRSFVSEVLVPDRVLTGSGPGLSGFHSFPKTWALPWICSPRPASTVRSPSWPVACWPARG